MRDKLWINGAYRNWRVDKLTLARNPDGSRAVDDNLIWNTSGKGLWQASANQKVGVSWNYNWKERFHRRDTPPNFAEDRASLWQTNPASSTQVKYSLVRKKAVFESTFGIMDGVTNYYYQPETGPNDIRIEDTGRSEAFVAAARHEEAAELSGAVRQRGLVHHVEVRRRPLAQGRHAVRADGHVRPVLGQRGHVHRLQQRRGQLGAPLEHADGATTARSGCSGSSRRTPGRSTGSR